MPILKTIPALLVQPKNGLHSVPSGSPKRAVFRKVLLFFFVYFRNLSGGIKSLCINPNWFASANLLRNMLQVISSTLVAITGGFIGIKLLKKVTLIIIQKLEAVMFILFRWH
jgi:hypothetical protein